MEYLIIIDCQYDFIEGTLACRHGKEAVQFLIDWMDKNPEIRPLYTSDWHRTSNASFSANGGSWPVHCLQNTKGAELDSLFYHIKEKEKQPGRENRFFKGQADAPEEYSAFYAVNEEGRRLCDVIPQKVTVGGIASEYCVRETVMDILKSGRKVSLLTNGLGWVREENHRSTLKELKNLGAVLLS